MKILPAHQSLVLALTVVNSTTVVRTGYYRDSQDDSRVVSVQGARPAQNAATSKPLQLYVCTQHGMEDDSEPRLLDVLA